MNFFYSVKSSYLFFTKWLWLNLLTLSFIISASVLSFAQPDQWININDGLGKCASIGGSGGVGSLEADNFKVEKFLHMRGEAYAYVSYQTWQSDVTDKGDCAYGIFKYDKTSKKWIRMTGRLPGSIFSKPSFLSNEQDIFGVQDANVFRLSSNYIAFPNGWEQINKETMNVSELISRAGVPMAPNTYSCFGNADRTIDFNEEQAAAIGDTIFSFIEGGDAPYIATDPKLCYMGVRYVAKFNVKTGKWFSEYIGKFPHEVYPDGGMGTLGMKVVITDYIAGMFRYFVSYQYGGLDRCVPNVAWVFDPRDKSWKNISKGVDYMNMTGNSCKDYTCKSFCGDTANDYKLMPTGSQPWAGGTIVPSWDKTKLYLSSQQGIFQWEGSRWIFIAKYWGGGAVYPTSEGFYVLTNFDSPTGVDVLKNANYIPVGNALPSCLRVHMWDYMSPDDGKTFFIFREAEKVECTTPDWSVYTTTFNPDRPASVRNLHIQTGTYVGSDKGTNEPVDVGVGAKKNLFIAGNYSEITGTKSANFKTINIAGASNSSPGKIIRMNKFGDTIYSVSNLGTKRIIDFNLQNYGKNLMVVATEDEVYLLDSSANFLWKKPLSDFGATLTASTSDRPFVTAGNAYTITDIDDLGNVALIRGQRFFVIDVNGNVKNPGGTSVNAVPTFNDTYLGRSDRINDIAIKNDTVFVTGMNNGCLTKLGSSGCSGSEVQSAFVRAFANKGGGNYEFIWRIYDITGPNLTYDIADTRGYHINVGRDGKLYFAGESAGPAGVFRWNGKTCQKWGNAKDITVGSDPIWKPTEAAHIAFFCTVDPKTGTVERGQFIAPENINGKLNAFFLKAGSIYADEKGFVYVGGQCAYRSRGREIQHVNGQLVGDYIGDLSIVIVDPLYIRRTFWGTFAEKRKGNGKIRGFGINGNVICVLAEVGQGYMVTGGSKYNPVTEVVEFKKSFVPLNEPFFPASGDDLVDTYLAVWYQDVWLHSQDSLEERRNPSNPVIPPNEVYWKANFDANGVIAPAVVQACVGEAITFTDRTLGAKDTYKWDFGIGANSSTGTTSAGPHSVTFNSPGEKSPSLSVRLQNGFISKTLKTFYVNVLDTTIKLPAVTGPTNLCAGSIADFQVGDFANPGVYGINKYLWEFPVGTTILIDNGYKVRIQIGATSGSICVRGKYACGITPKVCLPVTILQSKPNQVVFVTDSTKLNSGEVSIKTRLESTGYSVVVIDDNTINSGHAGCASLVFVSPSAEEKKVRTQLLDVAVPVIVSNPYLFDEFGFTNTNDNQNGTSNGKNLNIVSTHELAGGLTGSVSVLQNNGLINFGITVGNSIIVAKDGSGNPSFFGYEKGDSLRGVNVAKARRVGLFMNPDGIFSLSPDGLALFDRALCWALGNCPSTSTITLLAPLPVSLCPGQAFKVKIKTGGSFSSGNKFSVQLSNLQGIFVQVQTLGDSTTSAIGDIEIDAIMPIAIASGNAYKIRVVSSSPSVISAASPAVTILSLPPTPGDIFGNPTACANKTISTYSIAKVAGAITYLWDLPIGADFNGTSKSTLLTPDTTVSVDFGTSTTNEIKVYTQNACGQNPIPSRKLITITGQMGEPQARVKTITENKAICSGSNATYVASLALSATSYNWTVPPGIKIASGQGTNVISVDFGTVTSGNISVKAVGECGESATTSVPFTVTPLPPGGEPGAITGLSTVCLDTNSGPIVNIGKPVVKSSTSDQYSYRLFDNKTIETFEFYREVNSHFIKTDFQSEYYVTKIEIEWEFGENYSISTSTDNLTFSQVVNKPGSVPMNSLAVFNINKILRYINFDFSSTGTPSNFSIKEIRVFGRKVVEGAVYSISPVNGATAYEWTLPGGGVILSGAGTNQLSTDLKNAYLPGEVSVKAVLSCGLSKASSLTVSRCGQLAPSFSVEKIDSLCQNSAIVFKNTTSAVADKYEWNFGTGASPATFTGKTPPTVVYSAVGTKQVSLKITKDSQSKIATKSLEINAIATAPVFKPLSNTLCAGKVFPVLIQSQTGVVKYKWVLPTGLTGTSIVDSILLTASTANAYLVKVAGINKCGSGTEAIKSVVVTDCTPVAAKFLVAKKTVCIGEELKVDNQSTGSTNATWNFGTDGVSSSLPSDQTQKVTYTSAGKKYIKLTLEKGTTQEKSALDSLEVLSLPQSASSISGPDSICPNQKDLAYSVPATGGKTVWTMPAGFVIKTVNPDSTNITIDAGPAGGTIMAKNKTACGVSAGKELVVKMRSLPLKPASVTGQISVCVNTLSTYSVPSNSNETYSWSLNTGLLPETTSTINVNISQLSQLKVVAKNLCGISDTTKLTINTLSKPIKPVWQDSTKAVCGSTPQVKFSVIAISGATFEWKSGTTFTPDQNAAKVDFGTSNTFVQVAAKNSCGLGDSIRLDVNVKICLYNANFTSSKDSICTTESVIYTDKSVGAINWDWEFGIGAVPATATGKGPHVISYNISGAKTVKLTINKGTTNEQLSEKANVVILNSKPEKPVAITGNNLLCKDVPSPVSVPQTGGEKYFWWLGNEALPTSSASFNLLAIKSSTLKVVANNSCGFSDTTRLELTVNSKPVKPVWKDSISTICENNAFNFSVNPFQGVTYEWKSSANLVSTTNNANINFATTSSFVQLAARNSCGLGDSAKLDILVEKCPYKADLVVSKDTICLNEQVTFTDMSVGATTWEWSFGVGAVPATATGKGTHVISYNISGAKTVKLTINKGTTNEQLSEKANVVILNSKPEKPVAITGNNLLCKDVPSPVSVPQTGGEKYFWWLGNEALPTSSASFNLLAIKSSTLKVVANNSCGFSDTTRLELTVNSKPVKPVWKDSISTICENNAFNFSVNPFQGVTYEWKSSANLVSTTNNANINFATTSSFVQLAARNSCGLGDSAKLDILVEKCPYKADLVVSKDTICLNEQVTFTDMSIGATTWEWSFGVGAVPTTATGKGPHVVSYTNTGKKNVNLIINKGTPQQNEDQNYSLLEVIDKPTNYSMITPTAVCGKGKVKILSSGIKTKAIWAFTPSSVELISQNKDSLVLQLSNETSLTVQLSETNQCGTGLPETTSVAIKPKPTITSNILGAGEICQNNASQKFNITANDAVSYEWFNPNSLSVTLIPEIALDANKLQSGKIKVIAKNECGVDSVTAIVKISKVPEIPIFQNLTDTYCGNQTGITVNLIKDTAASTYEWILPVQASGNSTTASIQLDLLNYSNQPIVVKAKTNCGLSAGASIVLPLKLAPALPVIKSTGKLCLGDTASFDISLPSKTSAKWFVNGISSSSTSNKLSFIASSEDLEIKASVVDPVCGNESGTAILFVKAVSPPKEILTLAGVQVVCQGDYEYKAENVLTKSIQYNWTLPEGAIFISDKNKPDVRIRFLDTPPKESFLKLFLNNTCGNGPMAILRLEKDKKCDFWIADSFTPGSGNEFDTWPIHGASRYPKINIQVFNRWGTKVYESNGYEKGWDGTYNGSPVPTGVYYYVIDRHVEGEKALAGPVTIVR